MKIWLLSVEIKFIRTATDLWYFYNDVQVKKCKCHEKANTQLFVFQLDYKHLIEVNYKINEL